VRLVYLPSPRTHGVVARGSEIPAPRPIHLTVPHSCQHAHRTGTHLRRGAMGAASAWKTGADRATRPRFVCVGCQYVLLCGIPRSRQVWRGTDYEARE